MQFLIRLIVVCVSLGVAVVAQADIREQATFNMATSDGVVNDRMVQFQGGYPVESLVFSGELVRLHADSRGYEALIQVVPPFFEQGFTIQPVSMNIIENGASVSYVTYKLPQAIPAHQSGGTWTFRFLESYDDPGIDARWNFARFMLNDGVAPAATNLGVLTDNPVQIQASIAVGQVLWYRILLTDDIAAPATYLDIDTEGSVTTTTNDTEVALYDAEGRLVGMDDDDGSGRASQLTFGATGRSPVGDGASYNGRDGSLKAGVYYVAVGVFNTQFFNGGWAANSVAEVSGVIRLNIRTNTGGVECQADYNRSGAVNSQDFFDFLNDFFAGC